MKRNGFTLIEGIIAMGVIGSALIVGLALAISNLQTAQDNSDRIIAGNLAREGLEILRNVRDTNWIRREYNVNKNNQSSDLMFYRMHDFADGWPALECGDSVACDELLGFYFDPVMDDSAITGPFFSLAEAAGDPLGCMGGAAQPTCRIQKKTIGGSVLYYQNAEEPNASSGESYTNFYRRLLVKPICENGSGEPVVVFGDPPSWNCGTEVAPVDPVGVLGISSVVWRRGEKVLQVTSKERFYNWREF